MKLFTSNKTIKADAYNDISVEATQIAVKILKDSKAYVTVSAEIPLELRVATTLSDLGGLVPDIRYNVDKGVMTIRSLEFKGNKFPSASDMRELGNRLYNLEQAFKNNLD
nr:MAG TPA: hypothetical protein [Caudoviricetes sp.]